MHLEVVAKIPNRFALLILTLIAVNTDFAATSDTFKNVVLLTQG